MFSSRFVHRSAVGIALIVCCAGATRPASAQLDGVCVGYDEAALRRFAEAVPQSLPTASAQSPHAAFAPHTINSEPFRTHLPDNQYGNFPSIYTAAFASDSLLDDDLLAPNTPGLPTITGDQSDPLSGLGPDAAAEAKRRAAHEAEKSYLDEKGIDPHAEVFANTLYPSAATCAKCHKKIYDEWRVSAHAYAGISPMFHRFEQAVSEISRGTVGTFCMRCHAPIATQLKVPRHASLLEGPIVLREGVTCVACHRVVERYGRVNGERRIEPGGIYDPVVGNLGGDGINQVIANSENFKVRTDSSDKRPGQDIHRGAIQFEQLSDSSFCASCHQVVVQPGIALEVVYQQYRAGPACKKGISCQDCHMGAVPGKPLGYEIGAAAEMSGKTVRQDRKHANHMFHGPSYPIAHPALFPHNDKALRWKPTDLAQFDWRMQWGSEAFEKSVSAGQLPANFPQVWQNAQERRDAWKVIEENLQLVELKRNNARTTIELSSSVQGPFFDSAPRIGSELKFNYVVANTSEGHNMPSGSLGAQPQMWLNVVLIGPDGKRLFESGDVDRFGDLRDVQSLDVQQKLVPADLQLASYQTKFLITNVKGTDREFFFPIPVDVDPLPFFRPGVVPYTVLNHPPLARMEAHSIPPLDSRIEKYRVPANLIQKPGKYRLSVRLRSRVEPPYFARFVGLPDESIRMLSERMLDIHGQSFEFIIR